MGKRGRPKKNLDAKQIEEIERLSGLGLSMEDIAQTFDLSAKSLDTKMNENEEIKAAIMRGRAKRKKECVSKLAAHIDAGNVTSLLFYLKTQCGWKEGGEMDAGKNVPPLVLSYNQEKLKKAREDWDSITNGTVTN